jgi:hypothetical protein
MSEAREDPGQRLAEALRAQATRAPGESDFGVLSDSNFELLSGTECAGTYSRGAAEAASPPAAAAPEPRQSSAWWILAVAVLLGLGAGAVAGVMTLL